MFSLIKTKARLISGKVLQAECILLNNLAIRMLSTPLLMHSNIITSATQVQPDSRVSDI